MSSSTCITFRSLWGENPSHAPAVPGGARSSQTSPAAVQPAELVCASREGNNDYKLICHGCPQVEASQYM